MKYKDFESCGLKRALDMMSGKWKPLVMLHVFQIEQIRFTELWRIMPRVSKKVLLQQLSQMEADGLIERIQVSSFPPEVHYRLTPHARELGPLLQGLDRWANAPEIESQSTSRTFG